MPETGNNHKTRNDSRNFFCKGKAMAAIKAGGKTPIGGCLTGTPLFLLRWKARLTPDLLNAYFPRSHIF